MSSLLPSFDEAFALVTQYANSINARKRSKESVPLSRAAGRTLAKPLRADSDQPSFSRSTRDGYACRAAELSLHSTLPVVGLTRAGDAPPGKLPLKSVREIMTGAPVPAGADAVAMLEHVELHDGQITLSLERSLKPGENVVARGAQAHKGALLLSDGFLITHAAIALAASCGYSTLEVYARPRVAILSTGDEIIPVRSKPRAGQIRNSNSPMLAALVSAAGGEPWVLPITRDNDHSLDAALARARTADLVLISGGVSAGKFDLVEPALARAGARFHSTGVRIQPGKPLVFGDVPFTKDAGGKARKRSAQPVPFFGLPGNPVSSAVTFLLFAAPVLRALAGATELGPRFALAVLAADGPARSPLTRFLPARCSFGAGGTLPQVALVTWQGSGDLAAMALANCFVVLPESAEPLNAGAMVKILLY